MSYHNINKLKYGMCCVCKCNIRRNFLSTSPSKSAPKQEVIVERLNKVMKIGINQPETCNALNYKTANKLSDAISQFEEDDSVLVGIIYGVGGNFCSGFNLKEMNNDLDLANKLTGLRLTDRYVAKPMIAAVSGYAVGVGMDLALWCDVRIMEDTAVLGCFQRRFGIPQSQGALERLKQMVGLSRSLDWVMTGREIPASEAFSCGITSKMVASGTGLGEAYNYATRISKFAPSAVNTDRAALYLACLSDKHIQAGLISCQRENHLQKSIAEAAEGAKKFSEGHGRHGKTTGLFPIENNLDIDEKIQ